MPLSLPNLDDLRWEDLTKEGRALIPAWAPEWTNHNPSDPGITLMELLAYFGERLMYQLNRVGDKNYVQFLQLINGPDWKQHGTLADKKRKTISKLREVRRAVTAEDFEDLSQAVSGVARAKCIARRNLESEQPGARTADAPGHASMVIVPKGGGSPSRELLARVKSALEPARMLTTRVHAVGPRYLRVKCRFTVVPRRGVAGESLRRAAIQRLGNYFDPLKGGPANDGWPFGRNVYVSELYRILGGLAAIDGVMPAREADGTPLDELLVEPAESGRLRRNDRGELEAAVLLPDELVEVTSDGIDISLPPHI